MSPASLLAVSHGTDAPQGRSAIAGLVAAVAAALADVEVRAGFVDVQRPGPAELLDALESSAARGPLPDAPPVIVPLLLSAGYHVHVDLAAAASGRASVAAALGPDARLAAIAADRLARAGLRPGDAVVMAAAGSSDQRAIADCERAAGLLAARLGRPVTIAYLSAAAPSVADAVAGRRRAGASRVLVSPYLLAPGFFHDRAAAAGADATAAPLLAADEPAPTTLVELVADRYAQAGVTGVAGIRR